MKKRTVEERHRYVRSVLKYPRGTARDVEKTLRKLPGVKGIEFDYPTSTITVTYSSKLNVRDIKRALKAHCVS